MTMHCLVRRWAASFLLLAVLVSETLSIDEGMEKFIGRWKTVSTDNLGPFLKEIGIGNMYRQMITVQMPTMIFSAEPDGSYKTIVDTQDIRGVRETKFRLNEEIDDYLTNGQKAKSTFRLEDGKLVQYHRADVNSVVTTELADYNTLVIRYTANGVTATRVYARE